jgi:phospholipase C
MLKTTPLMIALGSMIAGCGGTGVTGKGTPDMAPMCPTPAQTSDSKAASRTACSFAAGAMPLDTLDVTAADQKAVPIKHIIVLMKENRSFDHLFGQLSAQGQPKAEPLPSTFTNPDATGAAVAPFHQTNTCLPDDPPHQWAEEHAMVDSGAMDGFVKSATNATVGETTMSAMSDGHFVMGYYDQTDIPFYTWLASNFALADHHFASVRGGTWANRDYLVAATSDGIMDTASPLGPLPAGTPLIFDQLDKAKVSWQVYTDDLEPLEFSVTWADANGNQRKQWGSTASFFSKMAAGTLESVTFIDATTGVAPPETDEHPPADVQAGEAWTRTLVADLLKSPMWKDTALIFTYDEGGGFFDHLPPGNSCAPSADQAVFTELGVRVPLIVVSPYARPKYVSKTVHEHTSITRLIEYVFNLPALTARDANSDALLDMFDFNCPTLLTPPAGMPAAGSGECTM